MLSIPRASRGWTPPARQHLAIQGEERDQAIQLRHIDDPLMVDIDVAGAGTRSRASVTMPVWPRVQPAGSLAQSSTNLYVYLPVPTVAMSLPSRGLRSVFFWQIHAWHCASRVTLCARTTSGGVYVPYPALCNTRPGNAPVCTPCA